MDAFGIDRIIKGISAMKNELPKVLANQAQNFFVDNFAKQGFDNGTVKKWKEVQRRIPGTPSYKYPKKKDLGRRSRAILQGKGSGQLRGAVNNSIREASFSLVRLTVSVPYASYLNKGTPKMPARKFIGNSKTLNKQHEETIKDFVNKAFNI